MKENRNIRIALVEDNKEIREGLAVLISGSSEFEFISSFADAESALKKIPTLDADVILMDINLPILS